jgi:hypothetical protein
MYILFWVVVASSLYLLTRQHNETRAAEQDAKLRQKPAQRLGEAVECRKTRYDMIYKEMYPLHGKETRVLVLKPGSGPVIKCEFRITDTENEDHQYFALSYTWSASNGRHTARVEDDCFDCSDNLYDAWTRSIGRLILETKCLDFITIGHEPERNKEFERLVRLGKLKETPKLPSWVLELCTQSSIVTSRTLPPKIAGGNPNFDAIWRAFDGHWLTKTLEWSLLAARGVEIDTIRE